MLGLTGLCAVGIVLVLIFGYSFWPVACARPALRLRDAQSANGSGKRARSWNLSCPARVRAATPGELGFPSRRLRASREPIAGRPVPSWAVAYRPTTVMRLARTACPDCSIRLPRVCVCRTVSSWRRCPAVAQEAARACHALMAEYYAQRASAGLIISEGIHISREPSGTTVSPASSPTSRWEGWKRVTEAVHEAGGRIMAQLWHVGRISDPVFLGGALPIAPSAVRPGGHVHRVYPHRGFVTPRALETEEIPPIVAAFGRGRGERRKSRFRRRRHPRGQRLPARSIPAGR